MQGGTQITNGVSSGSGGELIEGEDEHLEGGSTGHLEVALFARK